MKWLIGLIVVLTLGGLGVAYMSQQQPETKLPDAPTAEPVAKTPAFWAETSLAAFDSATRQAKFAAGARLFEANQCVGCHADNGRALKQLVSLGNRYNLDTLSAYLKSPRPPMPVFALTEANRLDLSVYLLTRYPGEARAESDSKTGSEVESGVGSEVP